AYSGSISNAAHSATNHVVRTSLRFPIYTAQVLPDYAQKQKLDPCKERDHQNQRRKPLRRAAEHEPDIDSVGGEEQCGRDRDRAEDRRRAQGRHRKGEDPVEGETQKLAECIAGISRSALRTFHRNASLAKSDPGSKATKVPMTLWDRLQAIDDPPRQEREVTGVYRQAHVREPGDQAVKKVVTSPQEPSLLAAGAAGIDDIESSAVLLEKAGNHLGRILQVPIHDDCYISRNAVEAG